MTATIHIYGNEYFATVDKLWPKRATVSFTTAGGKRKTKTARRVFTPKDLRESRRAAVLVREG